MSDIAMSLRTRATRARRAGWVSVALIISTVIFLVTFFFVYAMESGSFGSYAIQRFRTATEESASKVDSKESDEIKKLRLELELKKAQITKEEQQNSGVISAVSSAVTRVGAVLIGVYLIQILLGLTRYHFKLADHLLVCSEALDVIPDDIEKLKCLVAVISTSHIDFGKTPTTPVEKILEAVKDALPRAKNG